MSSKWLEGDSQGEHWKGILVQEQWLVDLGKMGGYDLEGCQEPIGCQKLENDGKKQGWMRGDDLRRPWPTQGPRSHRMNIMIISNSTDT